jgi:hypothetical protein
MARPSVQFFLLGFILVLLGCEKPAEEKELWEERHLTEHFKNYWFSGEAEITSYELVQSRYGEPRTGNAVLIYVTEDLLPEAQVKADSRDEENIPVLKLNATKNFVTGIYPYSIMQSTFFPLEGRSGALKVTASVQEWCGQVYMQLNNRNKFDIRSHSYFQGEADEDLSLEKSYLENEIWTQLRVDPDQLPVGDIEMIPSFEYIRIAHTDIRSYKAFGEFFQDGALGIYQVTYPELERELRIYYLPYFPFTIEKWEESTRRNGQTFLTTATKMESLRSDYWNKNSNNDLPLRDKLELN